jgi:hypothetical protein
MRRFHKIEEMQPTTPPAPQKLIDFNDELKALCDKYQYEIFAKLQQYDDAIVARLEVRDKSPKPSGVQLTPDVATPPTTDPAPVVDAAVDNTPTT